MLLMPLGLGLGVVESDRGGPSPAHSRVLGGLAAHPRRFRGQPLCVPLSFLSQR